MIHQADNILRQFVSSKMTKFHGNLFFMLSFQVNQLLDTTENKSILQETAKRYNDIRKLVLNELQTGLLQDVTITNLEEVLKSRFDQLFENMI